MSNGRKFHKNIASESLFEHEKSESELMKLGNPLEQLDKIIDFEVFRTTLEEALVNHNRKNNAGRRPPDPVFVSKRPFFSACMV